MSRLDFSMKELKSIVDSICYLEMGTRDIGFDEVNDALKVALEDIHKWMELTVANEPTASTNGDITPDDKVMEFRDIIDFLEQIIRIDKSELTKVLHVIDAKSGLSTQYH